MSVSRTARLSGLAVISLLLVSAAPREGGADPAYTRLTLSGEGRAGQMAEAVTITAGVDNWSRTASRAMETNATQMQRLRARLKRSGVAEADFRTADFRFTTAPDPDDDDGDRADGYAVRHQLTVIVRDVDRVGQVMDSLAGAGATDLAVARGWRYSAQIEPVALREARARAIADAMTKAQDYAAALQMKVGRIVSVQDRSAHIGDEPAALAAEVGRTQIDTRPQVVLASVGVEFELTK